MNYTVYIYIYIPYTMLYILHYQLICLFLLYSDNYFLLICRNLKQVIIVIVLKQVIRQLIKKNVGCNLKSRLFISLVE